MNKLDIQSLQISAEEGIVPLPNWAKSAIEIGAWARYAATSNDSRLLVCCVVPCRSVFTALVGFGSVLIGGALFEKGFSWADLLALQDKTEIFWKDPKIGERFSGIVLPKEEVCGTLMRPVKITKGPRKYMNTKWYFSESKFRNCVFSEIQLPSHIATKKLKSTELFFDILGVKSVLPWIISSGTEVRFVANRAALKRSLEGWGLTSGAENDPAPVDQLLILGDEGDHALAKARVSHVRGSITSDCPVSVLDGPLAFQRISDIETGSLVVVLERTELAEEHRDLLIQARHEHSLECERKLAELVPSNIPTTVEVTSYCLRTS
jgi:hypothetical protein